MRFLLDENLSPKVAAPLRAAGHDVTIAREVGLRSATDQVVIETARREARVLVAPIPTLVRSSPCRAPQRRRSFSCAGPRTAGQMSRQHSS
jgi:hypothetical protein